jgi:hypothetical protein
LRILILGQVHQTQAAEDVGGFGELNIVIADDLNAVAPRVAEVKERSLDRRNAGSLEAARTASLLSTTKPKWRPSSAGCLRPF